MNMCLLSMLLLTIGAAFLAALATYFKRQVEVDALNVRIKKMKTTLEKLDVEHRNSIAYYEGMREEITNYATERNTVEKEIEDLEKQIADLIAENETLKNPNSVPISTEESLDSSQKLLPTPDGDNGDGIEFAQASANKKKKSKRKKTKEKDRDKNKNVEVLSEQNQALEKEISELKEYKTKVEELEAKMESITQKMEKEEPPTPSIAPVSKNISGDSNKKHTNSPKITNQDDKSVLKRINRRRKEVDFETIGFSAVGRKDNLQKINGIEPFIEKKLNALGIYRFSQLANFNEEIAKKVSDLIEMENADSDILKWSDRAKTFTE